MSDVVIRVEDVSKQYRLGKIGTGTFQHDMNRWWHIVRGKEDPYLKIGEVNDRTKKGTSDYVWALKDISFDIKQGDVVGIIGRNGAGKSTLLKLLSRTTLPTTGSIKIKGRVASLLEVGTGFHPELTGRENIFLNGAILGMRKGEIKKKFDEIVDFSGVEKYIDTPVKRYSSGMYVRLAFAVAAHLEPEILIVDEVLAVGDAEFQKKAIGKMQQVSKGQGRTVIFVSHNMAAIENLCHNCILLKNGTLIMTEQTNNVINFYLNNIENKNTSIIDIDDRKGLGKVRFKDIKLFDHSGNSMEALRSGKKVIVRAYYESDEKLGHEDCRISLAIKKDNQPLVVISSELTIKGRINLKKDGFIDFIIDDFPLSEGYYDLTLFLEVMKSVQDWFTLNKYLQVIDGDFYGTGVNYPMGWQGKTVLVRHKMQIN